MGVTGLEPVGRLHPRTNETSDSNSRGTGFGADVEPSSPSTGKQNFRGRLARGGTYAVRSAKRQLRTRSSNAAPALFLDRFEELRMELSDQQLIAEAIETNHAGVRKDRTLDRYRDHLVHYSQYLGSAFGLTFYTARRKHVRMFMNPLSKPGGPKPHDSRLHCAWCKTRGYPDGRSGPAGRRPTARATWPRSNSSVSTFSPKRIYPT